MRRIVLSLWLAAGVVLLLRDAVTGGGIAGILLFHEIVDFGTIEPIPTYIGLAIPLIMVPAFLLLPRSREMRAEPPLSPPARRLTIVAAGVTACALAAVAIFAVIEGRAVPGREAPVVRLDLDATQANPVPTGSARIILRGVPRTRHAVGYDEVINGKFSPDTTHSHNFVPITEADWNERHPVRFITDLRGATALPGLPPLPWARYQETAPGVVLTDAVPTYLVRAFAARGVTLAPDARLHTTDAASVRETWYGIATIAGVFALATVFGGCVIR